MVVFLYPVSLTAGTRQGVTATEQVVLALCHVQPVQRVHLLSQTHAMCVLLEKTVLKDPICALLAQRVRTKAITQTVNQYVFYVPQTGFKSSRQNQAKDAKSVPPDGHKTSKENRFALQKVGSLLSTARATNT